MGTPSQLSPDFCQVVTVTTSRLTDNMYKFLTVYGQQYEEVNERSRSNKGKSKAAVNLKEKAKIIRESKLVPNLIYFVEQYEGSLIKLSKKSKVNLMQHMKRSTARDFRIRVDYLPMPSSDEDEGVVKRAASPPGEERSASDDDDEADEEQLTRTKRTRH